MEFFEFLKNSKDSSNLKTWIVSDVHSSIKKIIYLGLVVPEKSWISFGREFRENRVRLISAEPIWMPGQLNTYAFENNFNFEKSFCGNFFEKVNFKNSENTPFIACLRN